MKRMVKSKTSSKIKSILRSKKGSESVGVATLEVIFLVVLVFSAFIVGFWIMSLFQSTEQGTMESFKLLEDGINTLINTNNATVCYEHIAVDGSYAFVGFSRGQLKARSIDTGWNFDSEVSRPVEKCPLDTTSCITVCDVSAGFNDVAEDGDCQGQKLLSARSFDKIQVLEYATKKFDARNDTSFSVHDDLVYLGDNNANIEYILVFKHGYEPNYVITLSKLEYVDNAVLDRNVVPCQSLPEISTIPRFESLDVRTAG